MDTSVVVVFLNVHCVDLIYVCVCVQVSERAEADRKEDTMKEYSYPKMTRTQTRGNDKFILHVDAGEFTDSEIIVLLGENGTGKTTFVRMLAGLQKSDEQEKLEKEGYDYEASQAGVPDLNVSYKPQKISPKFKGTTRQLLHKRIRDAYVHPQFVSDVMKPLVIESIIDNGVQALSGGELQRLAITLALGKPADVYLIDEPSAYLDSEQRINCAKVIKRFIMHSKKTAFIVEHDFIMATYLADKVICFEGIPAKEATACTPESLVTGMNKFLKMMDITFRRDPSNYRPRINKHASQKDQEQKAAGNYFLMDEEKLTKEEMEEDAALSKPTAGAGGKGGAKKGKDKNN